MRIVWRLNVSMSEERLRSIREAWISGCTRKKMKKKTKKNIPRIFISNYFVFFTMRGKVVKSLNYKPSWVFCRLAFSRRRSVKTTCVRWGVRFDSYLTDLCREWVMTNFYKVAPSGIRTEWDIPDIYENLSFSRRSAFGIYWWVIRSEQTCGFTIINMRRDVPEKESLRETFNLISCLKI